MLYLVAPADLDLFSTLLHQPTLYTVVPLLHLLTLFCALPCSVLYPALRSLPLLRLPLPVLRLCRAGVGLARQPRSLTAVVGCVGSPALMGPEGRRLDDVLDSWRTSWFYYVRRAQAEFRREWAGRLGREIVPEPDGTTVMPVTYGRRCISA